MKSTDWKIIQAAEDAGLPDPGFEIDESTAVVITDPQNDFLHPDGVAWPLVKESVKQNDTINNMITLFKLCKDNDTKVFISPHWYFPEDNKWKFGGALEKFMHAKKMYMRKGRLNLEGFENSGADYLDEFKEYLNGDNVIICNPHKIFGPQNNDLVLQLRKNKINKVVLGGMSTNLCLESHLRHLIEVGFEVALVADASASAVMPGINSFEASLTSFRMIGSHVFSTEEFVNEMQKSARL